MPAPKPHNESLVVDVEQTVYRLNYINLSLTALRVVYNMAKQGNRWALIALAILFSGGIIYSLTQSWGATLVSLALGILLGIFIGWSIERK